MNKNFEEVREITKDIIERRMINMGDGIKADYVKVVFGIRFLLSLDHQQMLGIWSGIRLSETLTDFILDSTREFLLRGFNNEYTFETFCNEIAEAHNTIASTYSAIDQDITKNVVSKTDMLKNLICNPWFVLLLVCETIIVMEEKDV